jgi:hypothetical protein
MLPIPSDRLGNAPVERAIPGFPAFSFRTSDKGLGFALCRAAVLFWPFGRCLNRSRRRSNLSSGNIGEKVRQIGRVVGGASPAGKTQVHDACCRTKG